MRFRHDEFYVNGRYDQRHESTLKFSESNPIQYYWPLFYISNLNLSLPKFTQQRNHKVGHQNGIVDNLKSLQAIDRLEHVKFHQLK